VKGSIAKLIEGRDLTQHEAEDAMDLIMSGKATEAQIAAFLVALRMKEETTEELTAFASVMRKFSNQIHPKVSGTLVDTCGTGGDSIKVFNISTTAAFIVAGAGIPVAKHGNRSVTSQCGSADVLEALGLNLGMPAAAVEKSVEEVGIGFMFAPNFHPAMKNVARVRREIGVRTVFNLLGPLTNPANAKAQLMGVYEGGLTERLATVLKNLGIQKAMVVHGMDGLDEISSIGETKITLLKDGDISTSYLHPEDLGIKTAEREALEGSTPNENASTIFRILNNHKSLGGSNPKYEIALVNAAAAIQVGGRAETINEAMGMAIESIESGSAYKKLRSLIKFSDGNMSILEELEKFDRLP